MNKLQIIESVKERIPANLRAKDISQVLNTAYDSVLMLYASSGLHKLQYFTSKVEIISILEDNEVKLKLPNVPVFIPNAGFGVVSCERIGGDNVEAKPIYAGAKAAVKNLTTGGGMGVFVWYSVSSKDIIFYNTARAGETWIVKYLKKFEDMEYTDSVEVPASLTQEMYNIAMSILTNSRVVDNQNDNVNE